LQRYRTEQPHDPQLLAVSRFMINYPFANRLFPESLDTVAHAQRLGRAVILSDGDIFCVDETWLKRQAPQFAAPAVALTSALQRQEKEMIEAALAEARGRVSGPDGAATKLGLPRPTLDAKIKRLGIDKYRFKVRRSS